MAPLVDTKGCRFSPDRRWVAYAMGSVQKDDPSAYSRPPGHVSAPAAFAPGWLPPERIPRPHTKTWSRCRASSFSRCQAGAVAGLEGGYFAETAMGMLWLVGAWPAMRTADRRELKGHPPEHTHADSSIQMHAVSDAVPGPDGRRASKETSANASRALPNTTSLTYTT